MYVYYDSFCTLCTKNARIWKKIDWFNKLKLISFRSLNDYPQQMEEQLHVFAKGRWYVGFTAFIQIVKALPLLWICLPFMYLAKWCRLGDAIYEKVAKWRFHIFGQYCSGQCAINYKKDV